MTTVALYELADARAILEAWLAETEGELTPELEQLLDELQGKSSEKIERVALFIREQLATATAIEEEVKRLGIRVAVKRRAADSLKAYLRAQMERLGMTKVDGLLCTVAIQKNSAPAIRTALEGPALYAALGPDQPFVRRREVVEYSIDREQILAAWKAQQQLPPVFTVEQGTHIRIR